MLSEGGTERAGPGPCVAPHAVPMRDSRKLPATLKDRVLSARGIARIAAVLLCLVAAGAKADADKSIDVAVRINDHEIIVDVECQVRVTPQEAWSVMTDFDNATRFISKLEKSVILARTGEMLVVWQKGSMGFGPFSVPIETVSEIRLTPLEKMQSHLVSGNMKKNEATTRLIPHAAGTRLVYHLESIPDAWIPPIIGRALVEFETRGRFGELLDEMLRRKGSADAKR